MLYLAIGSGFACRRCRGLAYRSQSETPVTRAIAKARKLRVRLGGGPIVFDPLPDKPARMHRQTYYRLFAKAIKAQERALGLEIEEARRRFPGRFTPERGFPLTRDAAGPAKRNGRFFTARAVRRLRRGTVAAGTSPDIVAGAPRPH